jgi:NAD(P)-dependent dehydrogenase (short-subunit alcohol dehydrogenase family)
VTEPEGEQPLEQVHSGLMAGRTVLVTGGTAGIGRATALGLASMGTHLAITGRDRERAGTAARDEAAAARLWQASADWPA